jgi:hypothetical protein
MTGTHGVWKESRSSNKSFAPRIGGAKLHEPLFVGCLDRAPADATTIHDGPHSCSPSHAPNSPGSTGFRV